MKKRDDSKSDEKQPPVALRVGKDEMNFLERTFSSASPRPGVPKPIVFDRVTSDPETRMPINQRMTISFSSAFGRPSIQDDEVYVGLLAITHQRIQEGDDPSRIEFTRYELNQTIGWSDCGRSYKNIDRAINRLGGVWVVSDNAFYDRESKSWVDVKFHIINESHLFTREKYDRARERTKRRPKSWIEWGGPLLKSIQQGNLATFDLDTYRSIKGGVAKKLFRYSNKRLYQRAKYVIDIRELAEEKLGFKSGQAKSELKRKLEPSLAELALFGFKPRLDCKASTITVSKGKRKPSIANRAEPVGLEKALVERGVDRSGKKSAGSLVAKYPTERIQEQIENYDDRLANGEEKSVGWLIRAIENDYGCRKGFKSSAQLASEARKRNEKSRQDAAVRSREAKEERQRREADDAARREFERVWNSLSESERIALEDGALKSEDDFLRQQVLRARRRGEAGMFHQLLWEKNIMPLLADS